MKILVAVLFCVISAEIWNNVVECPITGRKKFLPLSDEQMAKYYKEFDDIQDADYEKQLSGMLGETCKIIGTVGTVLSPSDGLTTSLNWYPHPNKHPKNVISTLTILVPSLSFQFLILLL